VAYAASAGTQRAMLAAMLLQIRAMHQRGASRIVTLHSERTEYRRAAAPASAAKQHDAAERAALQPAERPAGRSTEPAKQAAPFQGVPGAAPDKRTRWDFASVDFVPGVPKQGQNMCGKALGSRAGSTASALWVSSSGASGKSAGKQQADGGGSSGDAAFDIFLKTVERRGTSSHAMHHISAHQVRHCHVC
jgi:hypothetical protein